MSRTARKQEVVAFVRDRILNATIAICAKKGVERATMAEIAASAGYSAPTLYQYFKSKEEILIALFERTNQQLCSAIDEPLPILRGLSFTEQVELLMRRQLASVIDRPEVGIIFTLIELGGGGMSPRLMRARNVGIERFMNALTEFIKRAMAESARGARDGRDASAPARDPETLALLYHAIGQAVFRRVVRDRGAIDAEDVERLVPEMLDLFLYGAMGDGKRGKRR